MKIKKNLIQCGLIILIASLAAYHIKFLVFSVMCVKWHFLNRGHLSVGSVEFDLPYNWWVASQKKNSTCLERVPPLGEGLLYLDEEHLTVEALAKYKPEMIIDDQKLIKIDNITNKFMNNEMAYSLQYRVNCNCEDDNTIVWIITIPSQHLVIRCLHIDEIYKDIIESEIIANIVFKPKA